MSKQAHKQRLVHPDKWLGRYVRHLANWRDFQWGDMYCVCEWTGRLMLVNDDAYYGDYFDSKENAAAAGYDECYYYSDAGLYDMWLQSQKSRIA